MILEIAAGIVLGFVILANLDVVWEIVKGLAFLAFVAAIGLGLWMWANG